MKQSVKSKDHTIKDSVHGGWVERAPLALRPYFRLARYDRPIGFWLLALPGLIGLAFASIVDGYVFTDIKWALLIIIGAVAMRGAGCTYNDIIDRDLDAKVERTALRPLPAKTVTLKKAWIWLLLQCLAGLIVLCAFPRTAQITALASLALVAAYPFMKRITSWPQAWLGLTFNWAVLVAYTAKTGQFEPPVFVLYAGLVFWTIGYDTIYACQDVEDDAMIGVKSTARLFGPSAKTGVRALYIICAFLIITATGQQLAQHAPAASPYLSEILWPSALAAPFILHLCAQTQRLDPQDASVCLKLFKSNFWAGWLLIIGLSIPALLALL